MLLPWILVFLVAVVILEWFLGNKAVYYFYYYITDYDYLKRPSMIEVTNTWFDCVIVLLIFFLPPLLLVQPVRLFVFMWKTQHPAESSQHDTRVAARGTTTTTTTTTTTNSTDSTNSTNPTIYDNPTNLGFFPRLTSVITDTTFHITQIESLRNTEVERNPEVERNTEVEGNSEVEGNTGRTPGFGVRRLSLFDLSSLESSVETTGGREEGWEEPPPSYSQTEGLDCPPPDYSQVEGGRLRLGRFIMVRHNKQIQTFRV